MAPNFIDRLWQSTAQPSSSQQPAQAATPAATGAALEAVHMGIERIERLVWLSGITRFEDGYYHYEDHYKGSIVVPEARVNQRIKDLFNREGEINIGRSNHTRREASLGQIIDADREEDCYVRQLRVTHGPNNSRYRGECYIPRREETPTRWSYEAALAAQSIEAVLEEPQPKRTVVFRGVPHKGKKVQVEVWQLDGQGYYRGSAHVYDRERRTEGEVQKVHVTIRAQVAHREYIWLQGDYIEIGSNRSGPFAEIEEPEEG